MIFDIDLVFLWFNSLSLHELKKWHSLEI